MTSSTPKHLRLVVGYPVASSPQNGGLNQVKGEQLALPLDDPGLVVQLIVSDPDTDFVRRTIENSSFRWIIDFRRVPRFDAIFGSRRIAFSEFSSRRIGYLDAFDRVSFRQYSEAGSNPVFWRANINELLVTAKAVGGPYLVLFDSAEFAATAIGIIADELGGIRRVTVGTAARVV